jgi:hypothetical protein
MNLESDAFCVIPNHFNAIVVIGVNGYNKRKVGGDVGGDDTGTINK